VNLATRREGDATVDQALSRASKNKKGGKSGSSTNLEEKKKYSFTMGTGEREKQDRVSAPEHNKLSTPARCRNSGADEPGLF
jgi:hypothetical protein